MKVDSIQNGYVIDHISAGKSMQIYHFLGLDALGCSIAIIQNVKSACMGKKDIIKIDQEIPIDFEMLGYIDPNITVNTIRDGQRVEKRALTLPTRVVNIIHCKNPRCITQVEQEIDHIFTLTDPDNHVYRCMYCESAAKG